MLYAVLVEAAPDREELDAALAGAALPARAARAAQILAAGGAVG